MGLVDIKGLREIAAVRRVEFCIAVLTAVVVCAVGVEQGIVLAIVGFSTSSAGSTARGTTW